jgi:glycosyltransferase involved in cell wall biosynthesis
MAVFQPDGYGTGKRMRAVIIADVNYHGGARTYFEMLVRLLRKHDVDIRALVHFPQDDRSFPRFAAELGILLETLETRSAFWNRPLNYHVWEFARLIPFMLRHRPDIVLISTSNPGEWLTPFLLPIPVLHILHTVVSPPGRRLRLALQLLLARRSRKRHIITVSHYASHQAEQLWGSSMEVIHNPTSFPEAVTYRTRPDGKKIIMAGHVIDYKNPDVWINVAQRVIARHPEATFTWYGKGPGLKTARMHSRGIKGISFPGSVHDMHEVYSQATVYFHPSRLENHSIAILEAMSYGLPCVSSDCGGLPESVEHNVTGFAENPDDAQAFEDRICSLLEDTDMRERMGDAGQDRVRKQFMPSMWEAKIISVMNNCLGRTYFGM